MNLSSSSSGLRTLHVSWRDSLRDASRIVCSAVVLSSLAACTANVGDEAYASTDAKLSTGATYMFQSGVTSSRCLDVAGAGTADRTNIQNWTCNFSEAQKYRVEASGTGVRLVNTNSGKCVDVDGNHVENLTNVQLYTCNGTGAQIFDIVDVGGGAVNIVHKTSGRCVGVADNNAAQGQNVRIRDCNNAIGSQRWQPRLVTGPVKIMPLGASITEGYLGTHAGYRGPLSTLLDQGRISHLFVGSSTANPGQLPASQQHHEGHPGWTIAGGNGTTGLAPQLPTWLGPNGADPDIVLLLVGSNDVNGNIDLANAGNRLDALLGTIESLKPRALLYVSTIPVIAGKEAASASYNSQVAAVVHAREARGEAVHLVDSAAALNQATDKADAIHPNDSGYDKIAHLWDGAIIGQ